MHTLAHFCRAASLAAIGATLAITMTALAGPAAAHQNHRSHSSQYSSDHMTTAEEIEAMIPSEEELAAMMPTEAEIRAMIPSEAELRAMIPVIETVEACHASGDPVHSEESTDPVTGREHMRLMICRAALADTARAGAAEARAEAANARTEALDGLREARNEAANARAEALEGLREARNDVASDGDIPSDVRAEVLASLDAHIAQLDR